MNADNTFQLSTKAAQGYEAQKVPALFGPLARATLDAISLPDDAHVIDIACGTGIITKVVAERLGGKGRIVGTDLNAAMLEVAQMTMPESSHQIEWFACDVTELPFEDGEFDIAFCQQGLQFFPDKPKALAEVRRVLKPEGRLYLACWRTVSPFFQKVADSLKQRINDETAKQALGPYAFRDSDQITSLLRDAGFNVADVSPLVIERRLAPAREAIRKEILAQPFEKTLLDSGVETVDAIVSDVEAELEEYRDGETITVPQEVNLFRAEAS
jgi:ubiquinone/menaquinone biosynthesis C-methylase UbiE